LAWLALTSFNKYKIHFISCCGTNNYLYIIQKKKKLWTTWPLNTRITPFLASWLRLQKINLFTYIIYIYTYTYTYINTLIKRQIARYCFAIFAQDTLRSVPNFCIKQMERTSSTLSLVKSKNIVSCGASLKN